MTILEDFFVASPREYTVHALHALGHAASLVELVKPELLEELAGGGMVLAARAEQREAAVVLARAAREFLAAAHYARDKGVL